MHAVQQSRTHAHHKLTQHTGVLSVRPSFSGVPFTERTYQATYALTLYNLYTFTTLSVAPKRRSLAAAPTTTTTNHHNTWWANNPCAAGAASACFSDADAWAQARARRIARNDKCIRVQRCFCVACMWCGPHVYNSKCKRTLRTQKLTCNALLQHSHKYCLIAECIHIRTSPVCICGYIIHACVRDASTRSMWMHEICIYDAERERQSK